MKELLLLCYTFNCVLCYMIYDFYVILDYFGFQLINYGFRVFVLNRVEIKLKKKLFHLQKQILVKLY